MIKNLNARLEAKGYTIAKAPVIIHLPILGYIWLPTWLTYEFIYRSPKNTCYTENGILFKLKQKQARRAKKRREALYRLLRTAGIHPQNPKKL